MREADTVPSYSHIYTNFAFYYIYTYRKDWRGTWLNSEKSWCSIIKRYGNKISADVGFVAILQSDEVRNKIKYQSLLCSVYENGKIQKTNNVFFTFVINQK